MVAKIIFPNIVKMFSYVIWGTNWAAVAPFYISTPSIWSSLQRGNLIPKKYRTHFRNIFGKVPRSRRKCLKSTPGKSEMWFVLGCHGSVWAGIWSVWIQIGMEIHWTPFAPHLDPIWVTYGPVLDHFRVFGLLLDYCWPFPYCSLLSLLALFPCLGSPLRLWFPVLGPRPTGK